MYLYARPILELSAEEKETLHKCKTLICDIVEMLNGADDSLAEPMWELIEERMDIRDWNSWYDEFKNLVEVLTEN